MVSPSGVAVKVGFNILNPFDNLFLSIYVYVMIILLLHASISAYDQKSFKPYVDEVVSLHISADGQLLREVAELKASPSAPKIEYSDNIFSRMWSVIKFIWHYVSLWLGIINSIFFIFVNFFMIYKLLNFLHSDMYKFWDALEAIFIMALLENVWTAYYLHAFSFPMAGVLSLILYIFGIANPLYETVFNALRNNMIPFVSLPPNATTV